MSAIIIFALLIQGYISVDFYTFGDKLVYVDEGADITSISGYKSVIDIDLIACAESCLTMPQCCNSFTYNTFRRECFLKLKTSPSQDVRFNNDGWQTYIFENKPGSQKVGSAQPLQSTFRRETVTFNHKGMNQLALNEGISLLTLDNKQFLSQVTPDDCAEACNRVSRCDSFSFNPNLDDEGRCYLKDSQGGSQAVGYSSAGWRTYWRSGALSSRFVNDDCYDTCNGSDFCIICILPTVCFER